MFSHLRMPVSSSSSRPCSAQRSLVVDGSKGGKSRALFRRCSYASRWRLIRKTGVNGSNRSREIRKRVDDFFFVWRDDIVGAWLRIDASEYYSRGDSFIKRPRKILPVRELLIKWPLRAVPSEICSIITAITCSFLAPRRLQLLLVSRCSAARRSNTVSATVEIPSRLWALIEIDSERVRPRVRAENTRLMDIRNFPGNNPAGAPSRARAFSIYLSLSFDDSAVPEDGNVFLSLPLNDSQDCTRVGAANRNAIYISFQPCSLAYERTRAASRSMDRAVRRSRIAETRLVRIFNVFNPFVIDPRISRVYASRIN